MTEADFVRMEPVSRWFFFSNETVDVLMHIIIR